MLHLARLRLARRCHLTEQIGARRRELYASDVFTPQDDQISWDYKSSRGLRHSFEPIVPQKPPGSPVNAAHTTVGLGPTGEPKSDPPVHTNIGDDQATVVSEMMSAARQMEVIGANLIAMSAKVPREAISGLMEEAASVYTSLPSTGLASAYWNEGTFAEEYLCLFHRLGISSTMVRLVNLNLEDLPRDGLTSLINYNNTLMIPPADELVQLRDSVTNLDTSSLSTDALLELARLQAFLLHPLIQSVIAASPSLSASDDPKKIEFPGKAEVKRILRAVPIGVRSHVADALQQRQVTLSTAYRLGCVLPRVSDDKCRTSLQPIAAEGEARFEHQLAFLRGINNHFKLALFSNSVH